MTSFCYINTPSVIPPLVVDDPPFVISTREYFRRLNDKHWFEMMQECKKRPAYMGASLSRVAEERDDFSQEMIRDCVRVASEFGANTAAIHYGMSCKGDCIRHFDGRATVGGRDIDAEFARVSRV